MLGSKLEQNYYWYNDEYMYFSFNGHHSSKYHLFIQNSKELTIENTVGSASEYSNAMMQEGTYYLGTSRKQKTFKRKCAAKLGSMQDYRRMMKWLTVGTTGELVFDNDRYWGWTVVLDTVGDATFVQRNNVLIVEFEITFKTIGTYLAHSVYPATWMVEFPTEITTEGELDMSSYVDVIGTNQYNIPSIIVMGAVDDYFGDDKFSPYGHGYYTYLLLQDISNHKKDIDLSILTKIPSKFIVAYDGQIYNQTKFNKDDSDTTYSLSYNSRTSFAYVDEQPAEENELCKSTYQPNGILNLQSQEPIELHAKSVELEEFRILIKLDDESWNEFKSNNYDYVCISKVNSSHTEYSTSEYIVESNQDYTADTWSYCGFQNMDDEFDFNIVLKYCNNKNIGTITLVESTKTIIINKKAIDTIIDDDYKIYCGYSQLITVYTPNTPIELIAKLTSYNNL